MEFKLTRAPDIAGHLFRPDHKPIAHVQVILFDSNGGLRDLRIENGAQPDSWSLEQAKTATTDDQGHFTFPVQADAFELICIADSGYAQLNVPAIQTSKVKILHAALTGEHPPSTTRPSSFDLLLKPWAKVEGVVMIGTKPAAKSDVMLSASPQPGVEFFYTGTADPAGKFQFERVPTGKVGLFRVVQNENLTRYCNNTLAVAVAGETKVVQIGGRGRTIIGRFEFPAGVHPETLRAADASLRTHIDFPKWPEMPAEIRNGSSEEHYNWLVAWLETPEGKAYVAAQRKMTNIHEAIYGAQMQADGSFQIDGVPSGTYDLFAEFCPRGIMTNDTWQHPLASVNKLITILPIPAARSDQPLDIGAIRVTPADQSSQQ